MPAAKLPPRIRDRPTNELVVLLITSMIVFGIPVAVVADIAIAVLRPDINMWATVDGLFSLVTTLVGAVIGFVAASREHPTTTPAPAPANTGVFRNRPAGESVIILFTIMVVFILCFMIVGCFVVEVLRPDQIDIMAIVSTVSDVLTTIVGAIIGYVAGKANPIPTPTHLPAP